MDSHFVSSLLCKPFKCWRTIENLIQSFFNYNWLLLVWFCRIKIILVIHINYFYQLAVVVFMTFLTCWLILLIGHINRLINTVFIFDFLLKIRRKLYLFFFVWSINRLIWSISFINFQFVLWRIYKSKARKVIRAYFFKDSFTKSLKRSRLLMILKRLQISWH